MQKLSTRPIDVSDEWLFKRVSIMRDILKSKLNCVSEYKQLLLHSKGVIAEAVPAERFWSCGLSKEGLFTTKSKHWPGKNKLGKLHMELREELQNMRTLLSAQQPHIQQRLQFKSSHILDITVDIVNVNVTVFAKSVKEAYAFTDDLSLPRKLVNVIVGQTHYGTR